MMMRKVSAQYSSPKPRGTYWYGYVPRCIGGKEAVYPSFSLVWSELLSRGSYHLIGKQEQHFVLHNGNNSR